MELLDILGAFGFPSIFTLLGILWGRMKANDKQTKAVQQGVQALLRDRLYHLYNKYSEKGYAPLYARDNFENIWEQYHNLGANGVMDDIHEKFKALPLEQKRGD